MKSVTVFVVLACYFVDRSIAYDDLFGDDYIEENLRNDDVDRLRLFEKFAHEKENRRDVNDDESENWTGRWMPDRPNDPSPPPKVFPKTEQTALFESSSIHRVLMGHPSVNCDDAKTNLTLDWDGNPINHTCYEKRIIPDRNMIAIKYCELVPKYYVAMHKCMDEKIEYDDNVPLYGSHRPLWPVYGEYKFLPKQRWLHSLEHGAIVMLYHPCANPLEVNRLKNLLTSCLRRHVITPYNLLDERHPLTLVAWGCRLSMSYVNPKVVIRFVREHALQGPESISRDGNFTDGLIRQAKIVSDSSDTNVCSNAHV